MNTDARKYPIYNIGRIITNIRKLPTHPPKTIPTPEPLSLLSAILACGYNSLVNGAARSFLHSGEMYKLFSYSIPEDSFKLTPHGQKIISASDLRPEIGIIKESAFQPPLFSALFDYFHGSLDIFCPEIQVACKELRVPLTRIGAAAKSYYDTLQFIKQLEKPKPQLGFLQHSTGELSIHYKLSHSNENLLQMFSEILSTRV